jgi:HAD superfamily hydrolase (TIGR01509 family)
MPAFIFDLDGTLIDSVYAHVLAWQQALAESGIAVDGWRINRRIGMSGDLLMHALGDELQFDLSAELGKKIKQRHTSLFGSFSSNCRPLRGSRSLLQGLREAGVPFGIATAGTRPGIDPLLQSLEIADDVVVVEGNRTEHPKPEPDAFLSCQQKLGVEAGDCFVVGDSVWDLLAASRARMFSIGLLTGGYDTKELFDAGAHRVFADPAELLASLYQLGIHVVPEVGRS